MQTLSTAPGVVQHRLRVWKDRVDRTARDDRQDREQVGRALAAASGNSISCRGSDSFSCGQQPEAGWELVLSWLVSPTVQGGSGVSLLRTECQAADSVSLPSCPRAFQRLRKQSEVDWFSCYLPAGGLWQNASVSVFVEIADKTHGTSRGRWGSTESRAVLKCDVVF